MSIPTDSTNPMSTTTDHQPFDIFARVITTLAAGKAITLPFSLGARNTEWSETFVVGNDRINGGEALLHKMRSRKNGIVQEHLADPCDWGLDDMRAYILDLEDRDFTVMEAQLDPVDMTLPTIARIANLAHAEPETSVVLAGQRYTLDAEGSLKTDRSKEWTLNDVIMAIRTAA